MCRIAAILTTILALAGSEHARAQIVNVESDLIQDFQVVPGGRYDGAVVLNNQGDEPASMVLYLNDYFRDRPDNIRFTDPGEDPHERSNLHWLSLSETVVTLDPHERRSIRFSIQVPSSNELTAGSGTYWASILVESLESQRKRAANLTPVKSRKFQVSLVSSYRTAIMITTSLADPGMPAMTFLGVSTHRATDGHRLTVDLRNDGSTAVMDARLWVEVFDSVGRKAAELDLDRLRVMLPGNSYRREVVLDEGVFGPGTYRCVVVVDTGADALYGTQASFALTTP